MDQHETYCGRHVIDMCRENSNEIVLLPPHTTHMLQPLDISIFNPLRAVFSKHLVEVGLIPQSLAKILIPHPHLARNLVEYGAPTGQGNNQRPVCCTS